jgi:hypothetical protein
MADLSTSEFAARCAIITAAAMMILWGIKVFLLESVMKMSSPIVIVSSDTTKGAIQGAIEGSNSIPENAIRKSAFDVARGFRDGALTSRDEVSCPPPH